jgi:cob(I)alamin adenosyltransferase
MRKIKIYTKTGDKGTTSLFTGERVNKSNPFIDALGAVDEACCSIGASVAFIPTYQPFLNVRQQLEIIQHALFDVGAALATPRTSASENKIKKTRFDQDESVQLESWIDTMEQELPQLQAFILPGGNPAGALLHVARSTVRRAERVVVPLYEQGDVPESVLIYLNRLSDYLFVASRYINHLFRVPETIWQPHKPS